MGTQVRGAFFHFTTRSFPMMRTVIFAVTLGLASASGVYATQHKKSKKAMVEKPLAPADTAQMEAAERTYFGAYECEMKQPLDVNMNPKTPGYVDVKFKNKTYTMKPVASSTGALRLEDVTGKTLLLQIANKSMLMDVQAGNRLVDDCVHDKQRAASVAAKM
jgi:membrane-bound inhibitor of C-type lysozyme